jgi:hypothetical protein
MWTYNSSNGSLAHNGALVGTGYSGINEGLNNPTLQNEHDIGPIPQGYWTVGDFFDDPGGKGPIVCHLTPAEDTDAFGRGGFMIHGDNSEADHTASHGCIILQRAFREQVRDSGDTQLLVV